MKLDVPEAVSWQNTDPRKHFPTLVGVDVGLNTDNGKLRACAVALDSIDLEIIDLAVVEMSPALPYIPGYLSFRELPAVLKALAKLTVAPSIVMCDGQGIAHPRRFGIACHLGVELGLPTIGIAKKKLVGKFQVPDNQRFASSELWHNQELVGLVLRSRVNVKPIFVSPGHLMTVNEAGRWVCSAMRNFKLPEATRIADQIASRRVTKKLDQKLILKGFEHYAD